ncbi:hypothetical protein [Parabacteroides sp.]|uniref:hypothetical protein n=1 Tax=Parabacteroides sp. TaxID=1869337 RepID=UPI00039F23C1|nr:hypothetical protein [Parabacteroides sp.]
MCKERLHTVFLSNFRPVGNGLRGYQRRKPRLRDDNGDWESPAAGIIARHAFPDRRQSPRLAPASAG